MAFSAATASPEAARRRLMAAPSGTSPPSPLIPTAPTQYGISTPVGPADSNPGTPLRDPDQREDGSAASTLPGLVRDLMKQLETANKTILDLGMKCAALQKELGMHKEFGKLTVDHAVALAKVDWDRQWQQLEEHAALAGRSAAPQPEAKPPPAPGFEASQPRPQPAAQGIVFHPPKAAVEAEPQETAAKITGRSSGDLRPEAGSLGGRAGRA